MTGLDLAAMFAYYATDNANAPATLTTPRGTATGG